MEKSNNVHGGANYSMATPCCSLHCQNVPHSLSYLLGVQVVAPRLGHHTNLGHLMGTLGTSGIGGGGGVSVEPLTSFMTP